MTFSKFKEFNKLTRSGKREDQQEYIIYKSTEKEIKQNQFKSYGFVFSAIGQSIIARQLESQQTEQKSSQYRRFRTQRFTFLLSKQRSYSKPPQ